MHIVRIGFSKPKNKILPVFSWLIRAVYRTNYSHVYVAWYSKKHDIDMIYEASFSGVRFIAGQNFYKNAETVKSYCVFMSENRFNSMMRFCMRHAGTKYGTLEAIGMGIADIFGLKKNPFAKGKKRMVCSELIGRILKIDADEDMLSPRDIQKYLDEAKGVYGII